MARKLMLVMLVVLAASLAVAAAADVGDSRRALLGDTDDQWRRCGAPDECRPSCFAPHGHGNFNSFCHCLHYHGCNPDRIVDICRILGVSVKVDAVVKLLGLLDIFLGK